MDLQRLGTFLKSYVFIRIFLNAVFRYVWIGGTLGNLNRSSVSGRDRDLLAVHAVVYNALLLAALYVDTLVFISFFAEETLCVGLVSSIALYTAVLVFYRGYIVDHIPGAKTYDFSYYSAFTRTTRDETLRFFSHLFCYTSAFVVVQLSLVFLGQHFFSLPSGKTS